MADTCDACPARAFVWWWRVHDRSEWKWCAHHNREQEQRMLNEGHRIGRDDRAELNVPA